MAARTKATISPTAAVTRTNRTPIRIQAVAAATVMAMNSLPTTPHRQRGIALITAILIVSIAVIAATAVLSSGSLAIQRTATLQETEKAWWYAVGVEAWVGTILQRDARQNKYDALNNIWAQPVDFLPVDQGFLAGRIVDLQGRFNLNNFGVTAADGGGSETGPATGKGSGAADPTGEAAFLKWQKVFERLFEEIKLDPSLARPISEAIRDWVDRDQNPTPYDGAEDNEYLSARAPSVPYRTANRPMQSVTELMAIKGVTKDIYLALLPYVSTLPLVNAPINVNTAPEALLRAMVAQPSTEFEQFLRERSEKPAETTSELTSKGVFGGADNVDGMVKDRKSVV
jgi:general secretion pathway protein K